MTTKAARRRSPRRTPYGGPDWTPMGKIELNPQYADLIRDRIGPMLEETAVEHHEAPERRLVGAGAV